MVKMFVCLFLALSCGTLALGQQAISTAGSHHAYEINVINQVDPSKKITLESEDFQDPAADILVLKIHDEVIENMKYQLNDVNGKTLEEAFIGDAETSISLNYYRPKNYFLKVMDNSKDVMVFKITKTDQP